MRRATYTFAKLGVSQSAYDEIREKLVEAGYEHAFGTDDEVELIDMHGIALMRAPEKKAPRLQWKPRTLRQKTCSHGNRGESSSTHRACINSDTEIRLVFPKQATP